MDSTIYRTIKDSSSAKFPGPWLSNVAVKPADWLRPLRFKAENPLFSMPGADSNQTELSFQRIFSSFCVCHFVARAHVSAATLK